MARAKRPGRVITPRMCSSLLGVSVLFFVTVNQVLVRLWTRVLLGWRWFLSDAWASVCELTAEN
jgi:hypothetical protein